MAMVKKTRVLLKVTRLVPLFMGQGDYFIRLQTKSNEYYKNVLMSDETYAVADGFLKQTGKDTAYAWLEVKDEASERDGRVLWENASPADIDWF